MSVNTRSVWTDPPVPRDGGPLPADTTCDVCVIGTGIAGLTTAYELTRAGKRVLVLEAHEQIAAGETAYTTAHLSSVLDDRFAHVRKVRGAAAAKQAYQAHASAIDFIEQTAARERIDCDFARVPGYLVPGTGDPPVSLADEERAARELGVPVERVPSPLPTVSGECLRFPNQGQFHPLKYLAGLAATIRRDGGNIATNCRVEKVEGGTPCRVTLRGGRAVTAGAVVVATNTPINNGVWVNTLVAPYHTYALAVEVPAGSVPRALVWDTDDPYHYVRLQSVTPPSGSDVLIIGGEDHKTGQVDDQAARWDRLEAWTRRLVPAAGAVRARWSGQVFETPDGLALIGPAPGGGANVFIATGDSGMGMTHGTIAGQLLRDLILGRTNPLAELFDPNRLRPAVTAGGTVLSEGLNMAAQYADWVTGGDVQSAADVKPGCGAVVRRGLTKVAVYRDNAGAVHEMSAVCPHMGAVVRWNAGEGTWDCPCHGSRFSATGSCLHGPAVDDLTPA